MARIAREKTKFNALLLFLRLLQPSLCSPECLPICFEKQLLIALRRKVSNWREVARILDITTQVENLCYTLRSSH